MAFFIRTVVLFANAAILIGCSTPNKVLADEKASPGIAVVELFTSEGCSSCPPADTAAGDLIREHKGDRVYVLAFHVDYWNHLGWADPYSQKAFSDRQSEYQQLLKTDNVYTPQVVVNGRTEFVGSDRGKLRNAVAASLATATSGEVSAEVTHDVSTAKVAITARNLPAGTIVQVAIVQASATTRVQKGENGGRTLQHANVVRAFTHVALDETGHASATLAAPTDGWPKDGSVIVYAQRGDNGQVLAASASALR